MAALEKNFFNTKDENNLVLYLRYGDDIFCIFLKMFHLKNSTKSSTNYINLSSSHINQVETKRILLDINIKLTREIIITKVHKKEFDTDVILYFSAITPTKQKRALILQFLNRAKIIASTNTIYKQEIANLKKKLIKNCYPKKFIDAVIEISINNNKHCTNKKLNSSNFKNILKVLYIGNLSSKYKKKL